jgi:ubiquinone/menaquinone biosynthesis C-methylase UbiE
MNDQDVRRFHDVLGRAYLAYAYPDHPDVYPTGPRRTEAVAQLVERRVTPECAARVLDIGCGRGDLCARLAAAGYQVDGVDFSSTMIEEAERLRALLPDDVRARVRFVHGSYDAIGLEGGAYNAVTAIGVLETESDESQLWREAARILQPNGTFVLTARNRLFNLASFNAFTRREMMSGDAAALLDEIEMLIASTAGEQLVEALREFPGLLLQAAGSRPQASGIGTPAPAAVRLSDTRQHTPRQLEAAAARYGFGHAAFVGVHPHLLPPAVEAAAPALYNAYCQAAERFAALPIALVWSSALVMAVTKS